MGLKVLLSSFITTFIGLLILLQISAVVVMASDPDNPITSAITSAINNITNTSTQSDDTTNNNPTPAPSAQPGSDPVTSPITEPVPTPAPTDAPVTGPITQPVTSPVSTTAPLTSPVLYQINPAVASFGDTVTLKSFWNILTGFKVFIGNVVMPESTYKYNDNNTSVSFVLGEESLLETGKSYLASLLDQFGIRSNTLLITITAPVVNPTPIPSATPAPSSPVPSPTSAAVTPVINTIFPNPATWGTHIVLTGSHITNSVQIYLNESLIPPLAYTPASNDGTTIEFTLPVFSNYEANQTYKLYIKQGNIKSNEVDLTIAPSLAYNIATPSAHQVSIEPQVNLDANRTEVLMAYSNFNTNISIPRSVTNPTLNFSNILIPNSYTNENFATFNNALTINTNTTLGTIKVEIPTATQINGPIDWDGIMNAPKILSFGGIRPTVDAGKTATIASVIEIGLGDKPLTFDKAVRILIPGQAGKLVGFQRESVFTRITDNCSADTQTVGDDLADGGDCYISSGNDLVIWTKHFTKFVTYTQTATQSNNNSSSGSSSGPAQAPVCGDSKPVSAPKLVYGANTDRNEVTLVWDKALNPTSYYLVAYGTKSGALEYGNPNIGDKNTTSYVVKGLNNGKTYYFKVRAGNGCMPGDFSNEISVKVSGDQINGPAKGFKSGVLSSTKAEAKFKPITEAQPARVTTSSTSLFTKVLSFFTRFFRG